jgi:hypothetical protein
MSSTDVIVPREQRALPVLSTVTPRRREPTPTGSEGMKHRAPRPEYTPMPIDQRLSPNSALPRALGPKAGQRVHQWLCGRHGAALSTQHRAAARYCSSSAPPPT